MDDDDDDFSAVSPLSPGPGLLSPARPAAASAAAAGAGTGVHSPFVVQRVLAMQPPKTFALSPTPRRTAAPTTVAGSRPGFAPLPPAPRALPESPQRPSHRGGAGNNTDIADDGDDILATIFSPQSQRNMWLSPDKTFLSPLRQSARRLPSELLTQESLSAKGLDLSAIDFPLDLDLDDGGADNSNGTSATTSAPPLNSSAAAAASTSLAAVRHVLDEEFVVTTALGAALPGGEQDDDDAEEDEQEESGSILDENADEEGTTPVPQGNQSRDLIEFDSVRSRGTATTSSSATITEQRSRDLIEFDSIRSTHPTSSAATAAAPASAAAKRTVPELSPFSMLQSTTTPAQRRGSIPQGRGATPALGLLDFSINSTPAAGGSGGGTEGFHPQILQPTAPTPPAVAAVSTSDPNDIPLEFTDEFNFSADEIDMIMNEQAFPADFLGKS